MTLCSPVMRSSRVEPSIIWYRTSTEVDLRIKHVSSGMDKQPSKPSAMSSDLSKIWGLITTRYSVAGAKVRRAAVAGFPQRLRPLAEEVTVGVGVEEGLTSG